MATETDSKVQRTCACGCGQKFTVNIPTFKKSYFDKKHRKHAEYIRRKLKEAGLPNPTLDEQTASVAQ